MAITRQTQHYRILAELCLLTRQLFGDGGDMTTLEAGHGQFILAGHAAAIAGSDGAGTIGALPPLISSNVNWRVSEYGIPTMTIPR